MPENDPHGYEKHSGFLEREAMDLELRAVTKKLEESRKRYEKSLALWTAHTFVVLIAAVVLIPSLVLIAFSPVESYTLKVATTVISGILGLLGAVAYSQFVEERRRRSQINELRRFEKEFFDRIKRNLSSRLT